MAIFPAPFDQKMSFLAHLMELRLRLLKCILVFLIGFGFFYFFSDHFLFVLKRPLYQILPPQEQKLYYHHLFENFLVHLKISGFFSLFFFSPYFLYECWQFIAPGLHLSEKKKIFPFLFLGFVFFIFGVLFAYFFLIPYGLSYFLHYGTKDEVPMLSLDAYYSVCLKLFCVAGITFEFPILLLLLCVFRWIDASFLEKHRKNTYLGLSVFSALFAPPDAVSMLLLVTPLILFYEVTLCIVKWIEKKRT